MGLALRHAVYQVRKTIGELEPFNWSDYQIIADLNYAAQEMCSVAGTLTRFQQLVLQQTLNGQTGITQETFLADDLDEIKAVKYFSGQLFDLDYCDWKVLQSGASTGSIPLYYYTKTGTRELTPQSTSTSDIVDVPIGPQNPLGDTYRTVIGVWPIPPTPATLHVWYSYMHTWMSNPNDNCVIPSRFLWAWSCGAISKCKEIEGDIVNAQRYDGIFRQGIEDYRVYAGKQKQGDRQARYGTAMEPWRRNPSSSVILVDPSPQM